MFVDRVRIQIAAGKGGDGCLSFRREKYVPRGGPDGGDGGDGGSVILLAEAGVDSLAAVAHRKHLRAGSGGHGEGANRHGRSAEDLIVPVPPGTVVIDAEKGFVLKDLASVGETVIAARGGSGGHGNSRFKTATNRAPRQFTKGTEGEIREVVLELKMIADVGLLGKPNAGKSTLLARVSRARPEIADYPFTTKTPNLGRVEVSMDRWFLMADIPGLVEGAHAGVGLGHDFLRHVERTRLLVHLVEPMPMDGSDPVTNYRAIRRELELHSAELASRPQIVCMSKCELPGSEEVETRLAAECGEPVLAISAVTGQGLDKLLIRIVQELDREPAKIS
ncbi:MAG: GTPase ObgE [Planctomycetia bacterium]|nr:GTPase ObgE [Planctomycetia bacterium]